MRTPIADFVKQYADSHTGRLHMPGHKGVSFLGCEPYDITEIKGADELYEADGIIAQSEQYAAELFGTQRTVYATEGSSQCIRAMLYLALNAQKGTGRPYIIAARNVHKSFLYAAALLDFDVVWLWPEEMHSLCSCQIAPEQVEAELSRHTQKPAAVYVTCPDYLGGQLDLRAIADICHAHGTLLVVDNAHGAYLHFLPEQVHPMDVGADLCCDSAHKTLPVLTGGAYLHIGRQAPECCCEQAKQAMALFGSTSPSYLILTSLDLCNAYLADDYGHRLAQTVQKLEQVRTQLRADGWQIEHTDPLKLTIKSPAGMTGYAVADLLRSGDLECEYADEQYVVCMVTPENRAEDFSRLADTLGHAPAEPAQDAVLKPVRAERRCTIREAVMARHESLPVHQAVGRICGAPTVGCPPAIPIAVSGEVIQADAVELFAYYHIDTVDVVI